MKAHESINAKGFYENLDFVRFHEQVLESLGESRFGWTTKFDLQPPESFDALAAKVVDSSAQPTPWGWKDPRTTLFLSYWARRLPKANFVFVHRAPWEVIDSLYRRGDQEFQAAPRLAVDTWTSYNRAILNFMDQNSDRGLVAALQTIVDDPGGFVERLNERFSLGLKKPADDIFDEKLIERSTTKANQALIIQKFFPECMATYEELLRRSDVLGGEPPMLAPATISDANLADVFIQEWSAARNAQRELKGLNKTLYEVRSELFHTNEKLQNLERSRFWKLRNIVRRLKQN